MKTSNQLLASYLVFFLVGGISLLFNAIPCIGEGQAVPNYHNTGPATIVQKSEGTIRAGNTSPQQNTDILPRLPIIPSDLKWVPVTGEERENTKKCSGPLSHCCIGQCRQRINHMDEGTPEYEGLFMKPDMEGLIGMEGLLKYLHHFVQHKEQQNLVRTNDEPAWCTLWFVGDSMSHDHVTGAMCALSGLGYEIAACASQHEHVLHDYGDDDKFFCNNNRPTPEHLMLNNSTKGGGFGYTQYDMISPDSEGYCSRIRVKYTYPQYEKYFADKSAFFDDFNEDEAGIIVYNWGIWANSPDEMTDHLNTIFRPSYDIFQRDWPSPQRYMSVWREHEPQHFAKNGGAYDRFHPKESCSSTLTEFNSYRNEIAENYIRDQGLQLPIVRLFDALTPLHNFHYGGEKNDCTHYCYSPWRFDLTWHGIALALQDQI